MFENTEIKEIVKGSDTKSRANKLIKDLNNQDLTLSSLKLLFPDIHFNENDVNEINEIIKSENVDSFSELIGLLLEHKDIILGNDVDSLKEYIEAMRFVSYVNSGLDITKAYIKVVSHRKEYQLLNATSKSLFKNEARKNAMIFAKSKIVMKIQSVFDYPLHLVFAGYRYKAIDVLAKEMTNAPLAKDRVTAADRLLHHLTPLMNNTNININAFGDKATMNILDQYKYALDKFATEKKQFIRDNTKNVANRMTALDIEDIINIKVEQNDKQ